MYWTILGPVAIIAVSLAVRFTYSEWYIRNRRYRVQKSDAEVAESIVASLKLKAPPGATMIRIAHVLVFNDARNREFARQKTAEQGITWAIADTASKFWLRVVETIVIDDAIGKIARMADFAQKCGGAYDHWETAEQ